MKIQLKLIIITLIFGSMGCEKQADNAEVETYINQLKSNQYGVFGELPAFTSSDIPALLNYRNEDQVITNFPHNPISSFFDAKCKLGIYVLWTIESIRAVETNSEYLIGRFPSQNPILTLRSATEFNIAFDDDSHTIAAKAYYNWWHSSHLFKDKMKIDPLKNTDYKWH